MVLKGLIKDFCTSLDDKLQLIVKNLKMLKTMPLESHEMIEQIQSDFEVQDNLTILVL